MARQAINIGSSANDGTGDPLRTAFDKINDNFVELYGSDNDLNTLDANLDLNNFAITTGVTNGDITVTPNGTGSIKLGSFKFNGTTLSSDDSTLININEGLVVDGTANISGATTLGGTLTVGLGEFTVLRWYGYHYSGYGQHSDYSNRRNSRNLDWCTDSNK